MMRFSAYNRLGGFMGTSWPASCTRWHGVRGNALPMIPLFPSQGAFCATAVAFPFDLGMVPDGCGGGQAQPILDGLAIFVFSSAEEAPVLVSESPEVAIFHPSLALPWMSPSCPSPQCFEDGGVDMDKGLLGRCMSVIVCPPSYFRVE